MVLTDQQIADLATRWTTFGQNLNNYANTGQNDAGYDPNALSAWMQTAAGYGNNFSTAAMTADFANADADLQTLKGALDKANTYISGLNNQVTNWNNLTRVVNGALAFGQLVGGGAASTLVAAAQNLIAAAA
jgi:hypothetical protein